MAIKPVNFEQYLQWFDRDSVITKAKTARGIQFTTTKGAAAEDQDRTQPQDRRQPFRETRGRRGGGSGRPGVGHGR